MFSGCGFTSEFRLNAMIPLNFSQCQPMYPPPRFPVATCQKRPLRKSTQMGVVGPEQDTLTSAFTEISALNRELRQKADTEIAALGCKLDSVGKAAKDELQVAKVELKADIKALETKLDSVAKAAKDELQGAKVELKGDIKALETKFDSVAKDNKEDLKALGTKLDSYAMKVSIIIASVSSVVALIGLYTMLLKAGII